MRWMPLVSLGLHVVWFGGGGEFWVVVVVVVLGFWGLEGIPSRRRLACRCGLEAEEVVHRCGLCRLVACLYHSTTHTHNNA